MQSSSVARAAEIVVTNRLAGTPLGLLPDDCRPATEEDGYRVQREVHRLLAERGRGGLTGYKIGCTTTVMQQFLKTDHPCAGGILASSVSIGSGEFALADFVRVGVECEIAVMLGHDLSPDHAPFSPTGVAAAVSSCRMAIEVVDNRYTDFTVLGLPTMIADDFFAANCVLGADTPGFDPRDMIEVTGTLEINGEHVGQGQGRDILDDPLAALAWLANRLAQEGGVLYAGQFVLLGSIVRTVWLDSSSEVVVASAPLGSVSASFG